MDENPTRRGFWLVFRLRSLFVVVTLLAFCAAWVAYERQKSQRQLAIAESLEPGWLVLGGSFDDADVSSLGEDQPLWRELLGKLLGPRVQMIGCSDARQTNKFTEIGGLAELQSLEIDLRRVDVVSAFSELKNLELLDVTAPQVTDISPLGKLTNLRSLRLCRTQISDLSPLVELTKLKSLSLRKTGITDLSSLAWLKSLQKLSIHESEVTDLAPLVALTNLQALSLNVSQVTDSEVNRLRRSLPNCKINNRARLAK